MSSTGSADIPISIYSPDADVSVSYYGDDLEYLGSCYIQAGQKQDLTVRGAYYKLTVVIPAGVVQIRGVQIVVSR